MVTSDEEVAIWATVWVVMLAVLGAAGLGCFLVGIFNG